MSKVRCVISCPIDTYSGYGGRSRDLVKALIKSKPDWDIKILSQRWGNTRRGWLADHDDNVLTPLTMDRLNYKPEVWVQITVPNEFQPIGVFNIGVTAGIETTICHSSWLEGCNRMNLVLTSSNHSKGVFGNTKYEIKDQNTNQVKGVLELKTPVEVVFEGLDTSIYRKIDNSTFDLSSITEESIYLVVGHWLPGDMGHDRKNIGYTIKAFLETFKNKNKAPALLLKTQSSSSSIIDRELILDRIDAIRRTVKGSLPNIHLLHGDLSDQEINELYNHPKVKALVSLTKGEGFGRPLLEFTATGKPIIASGWSGHTDFLKEEFTRLIPGQMENVHPSACSKDMIIPQASWFRPDDVKVAEELTQLFKLYKNYLLNSEKQKEHILDNFTTDHMETLIDEILSRYLPIFPEEIKLDLSQLQLPTLKKIK